MTQRWSHKHHCVYSCWKLQALQSKTDLWCAYLDPVWFHSVEVLTMRSYNLGIARKWACCTTRDVYIGKKFVIESRALGKLFGQSDINFNVLPLMLKVVPDSSYTVTCLPLQIVTDSCLLDKTHLWDCFLFFKWHVPLRLPCWHTLLWYVCPTAGEGVLRWRTAWRWAGLA